MAGILDKKTRILDSVVTEIGRRQISTGRLRVEFVSLTDSATYYEADEFNGSVDPRERIYFESPGKRKQDFITFETDDSGNLLGFPIDTKLSIVGDELFENEPTSSNVNSSKFVKKSGKFASLSAGIVTSSINHFKENYMIGSLLGEETLSREFKLSKNNLNFKITNSYPFENTPQKSISDIDSVEPLFMDKRLSHIPNFKFLPPLLVEPRREKFSLRAMRRRRRRTRQKVFLGNYKPINEQQREMTYRQLMNHLNGPKARGVDPDDLDGPPDNDSPFNQSNRSARRRSKKDDVDLPDASISLKRAREIILFSETSEDNNIVMQMFETNDQKLKFKKLDVIDFGEFSTQHSKRPNKHIFFAGKVFLDSFDVPTYVNLFTIVLD